MRILIDECLNGRLIHGLTGHYAVSVQKMGWSEVKNGTLLALAIENKFDVFITADRNMSFQQPLPKFDLFYNFSYEKRCLSHFLGKVGHG